MQKGYEPLANRWARLDEHFGIHPRSSGSGALGDVMSGACGARVRTSGASH
jgi:hypothetical protein